MNTKPPQFKPTPFEDALAKVMAAIDTQVAREMQRTPAELGEHGVKKWEPYQKRIELIVSALLNALGEDVITLDSVFVFSQAVCKTLLLVVEDLEADGLGKARAEYSRVSLERIADDAARGLKILSAGDEIM